MPSSLSVLQVVIISLSNWLLQIRAQGEGYQ